MRAAWRPQDLDAMGDAFPLPGLCSLSNKLDLFLHKHLLIGVKWENGQCALLVHLKKKKRFSKQIQNTVRFPLCKNKDLYEEVITIVMQ